MQISEWLEFPRPGLVLLDTCGLLVALVHLGALPFWADEPIAALRVLDVSRDRDPSPST